MVNLCARDRSLVFECQFWFRIEVQVRLDQMALALAASRSFGGRITSTNGSISRQLLPASKPAPVVDLPALQSASRVLQDQFIKDAQVIPDLVDTLTTRESFVALSAQKLKPEV
jgi:hypothetical protein